jgi:hypothetical protein
MQIEVVVENVGGYRGSCLATVRAIDPIAPVLTCTNKTVYVGPNKNLTFDGFNKYESLLNFFFAVLQAPKVVRNDRNLALD